ncbi:hypothetical protein B7494_g1005 [Chlorociboria aeruginascens]|nr:hypothetical protein B7494_g1005 [Chlorociboria aeruginascens]
MDKVRRSPPRPKALLFDFMGTCLDWHGSVSAGIRELNSKSAAVLGEEPESLAMKWRMKYFEESRGKPPEDVDVTLRRILDTLLEDRGVGYEQWNEAMRRELVQKWHSQKAWPDMARALERLRKHFDVVVHANGSTRLQIDLVKSSGLQFHTLISSQMTGVAKPDPIMYLRAAELLKLETNECLAVAAHAYDVRGARDVATEDPNEDMAKVREEMDYFVDGREGSVDAGLGKLADILLDRG